MRDDQAVYASKPTRSWHGCADEDTPGIHQKQLWEIKPYTKTTNGKMYDYYIDEREGAKRQSGIDKPVWLALVTAHAYE